MSPLLDGELLRADSLSTVRVTSPAPGRNVSNTRSGGRARLASGCWGLPENAWLRAASDGETALWQSPGRRSADPKKAYSERSGCDAPSPCVEAGRRLLRSGTAGPRGGGGARRGLGLTVAKA